jgi:hypothetical protein
VKGERRLSIAMKAESAVQAASCEVGPHGRGEGGSIADGLRVQGGVGEDQDVDFIVNEQTSADRVAEAQTMEHVAEALMVVKRELGLDQPTIDTDNATNTGCTGQKESTGRWHKVVIKHGAKEACARVCEAVCLVRQ